MCDCACELAYRNSALSEEPVLGLTLNSATERAPLLRRCDPRECCVTCTSPLACLRIQSSHIEAGSASRSGLSLSSRFGEALRQGKKTPACWPPASCVGKRTARDSSRESRTPSHSPRTAGSSSRYCAASRAHARGRCRMNKVLLAACVASRPCPSGSRACAGGLLKHNRRVLQLRGLPSYSPRASQLRQQ
jgi:hypothetical protein